MLPDKLQQILNGDDSLETREEVANIFLDLCQDDKVKEFAQILLVNIETLECPEGIFERVFLRAYSKALFTTLNLVNPYHTIWRLLNPKQLITHSVLVMMENH